MPPVLRLTLAVDPDRAYRPEGFVARCRLANDGDEPALVNLASLSSPSLALEISDERGEPVLLPPPPVPPHEPPTTTVEPGQGYTVEFAGFLPAWTPPGRYRARSRYVAGGGRRWVEADLRSEWVGFGLDSPG